MDAKMYNPVSLAFLGDGVYELLVRRKLLAEHGSLSANKLHKLCVAHVKAAAQSEAFLRIQPLLTEEEQSIFLRGRNANNVSVPKSATPQDYRRATGLEALFGFLYLSGRSERIEELFSILTEGAGLHEQGGQGIL